MEKWRELVNEGIPGSVKFLEFDYKYYFLYNEPAVWSSLVS